MKPTDASYMTIQEADILARNSDGELTEVRKALDIADAYMCMAVNAQSKDERDSWIMPASAITTLVQVIEALERKAARKGRYRNAIIEECAKACETEHANADPRLGHVQSYNAAISHGAAAIRALKEITK